MTSSIAAIVAALAVGALLMLPWVTRRAGWRAVATPLASIIGSGFLVSVPILDRLVGNWAVIAMAGLMGFSYLIGAAIRDNIRLVEPALADKSLGGMTASAERFSHLILSLAYFVSVAFYLVLFASFLLKPFGIVDSFWINVVVTVILTGIGVVGLWRGFRAIEGLEVYAVSLKLSVIAGLLAGLIAFWFVGGGEGAQPGAPGHFEFESVPVLLGLLILVQGFETSRFLGAEYDADRRIRSMRQAQWLAGAIYIGFFIAVIPVSGAAGGGEGITAIVDMLRPASVVLPLIVVIGALASQSSAALADMLGASGLLHDISGGQINPRHTYPAIALVTIALVWATDIYALIAVASRSFALYYALQCGIAAAGAVGRGERWRGTGYWLLAALCVAVVLFGAPAEGG